MKIVEWIISRLISVRIYAVTDGRRLRLRKHYYGDAGIDIHLPYDLIVKPGKIVQCETNCIIKMKSVLPVFGCVFPRSSSGARGICVIQSIYDKGYNGKLIISIYNITNKDVVLNAGDRVAQFVPMMGMCVKNVESNKQRGNNGCGSTGA